MLLFMREYFSWLEALSDKQVVVGSSPTSRTFPLKEIDYCTNKDFILVALSKFLL